jgi:hypothetical protein
MRTTIVLFLGTCLGFCAGFTPSLMPSMIPANKAVQGVFHVPAYWFLMTSSLLQNATLLGLDIRVWLDDSVQVLDLGSVFAHVLQAQLA